MPFRVVTCAPFREQFDRYRHGCCGSRLRGARHSVDNVSLSYQVPAKGHGLPEILVPAQGPRPASADHDERTNIMKALVYHGPGKRAWEEVPDAAIQEPTDAVVRVDAVTICGTDLHILGGDVPEVAVGRILGHEAVGTVTEVGPRFRSSPWATASWCRASPRAAAAGTAARAATGSASAVAAGSSAT